MPRDLADVLHYFMPELDAAPETDAPCRPSESALETGRVAAVPTTTPQRILGLPIGERDVVRAALAWNLVVESARRGNAAVLLAPRSDEASPLWPAPGPGPLGTEIVLSPATDLEGLQTAAVELAAARAGATRNAGFVFVRIPPAWLAARRTQANPIGWWLLLTSANRRDLRQAYDLASRLVEIDPAAQIGVTLHGVSTIPEARAAFDHLARISKEGLGVALRSYGLLVDDLHVYRAIAAQRPIGLEHPQAPATRALMDVARLLEEDARGQTLD